ncbi:hypothetical protein F5Y12DRAFT_709240 [Xylaria sp. FL1777]|nr:hypothetical protein F5Y12DRAFT_709240 [Xylaria sp. FL1777]
MPGHGSPIVDSSFGVLLHNKPGTGTREPKNPTRIEGTRHPETGPGADAEAAQGELWVLAQTAVLVLVLMLVLVRGKHKCCCTDNSTFQVHRLSLLYATTDLVTDDEWLTQ